MELRPGYAEGERALAEAKPNTSLENVGTGGTFTIDTPAGPSQVQGYFNKRAGQHYWEWRVRLFEGRRARASLNFTGRRCR